MCVCVLHVFFSLAPFSAAPSPSPKQTIEGCWPFIRQQPTPSSCPAGHGHSRSRSLQWAPSRLAEAALWSPTGFEGRGWPAGRSAGRPRCAPSSERTRRLAALPRRSSGPACGRRGRCFFFRAPFSAASQQLRGETQRAAGASSTGQAARRRPTLGVDEEIAHRRLGAITLRGDCEEGSPPPHVRLHSGSAQQFEDTARLGGGGRRSGVGELLAQLKVVQNQPAAVAGHAPAVRGLAVGGGAEVGADPGCQPGAR